MDNLSTFGDLDVREEALSAFASTMGAEGADLSAEFDAFMQPDLTQVTPLVKSDQTPAQINDTLTRGIDLHTRGFAKEAMELYHEVLLHDPTNKKCLYFTAIALSQQKQPEDQVLALMEHACEGMSEVAEAQYNLGILYHRMGRPLDAIPRFELAIKKRSNLVEAKTSLGGCYLNDGQHDRGKEWLTRAAKTNANDVNSV